MPLRSAFLFGLMFCLSGWAQEVGDAKQRVKTARALGKQGSESLVRLETLLRDPELEVRVEAVKAITEVGTQRSLPLLIQATQDNDPEVQMRATDGLVNFYLPGYVKTGFTASLQRVGTNIKGRWTDTNGQMIDPYVQVQPEVIAALGKLARGGVSMEARANAARGIGVLRGKAAVPDLLVAVKSKDDQVLYESLVALQKIRDPNAASGISFLLRDLNQKVQLAAIETTGLLQNKEALPDLREVLKRTKHDKVRRAALVAIAMIPDESSRDLYTANLNSKDDGMRAAAAEGFARLGNPADLPALETAFNEERKMNARLSAAFALVALGKTEVSEFSALQYLINTLNSSAYRDVAQAFLVELTRKPEVRSAVYTALPRGTRDEKVGLAQVLARSGDETSVAPLDTLSRDADLEVQQEALRSLRNLKARLP